MLFVLFVAVYGSFLLKKTRLYSSGKSEGKEQLQITPLFSNTLKHETLRIDSAL